MVPLQLDSSGKVKYDVLAKMGQRKDKVVHTSLQAMVPKERPTDPELMKPDEEEIEKVKGESGGEDGGGDREHILKLVWPPFTISFVQFLISTDN